MDSDSLQAFYAKDTITNSLIFRTNVLVEAINNFQANEDDVTFDLKEDCVFLRNYEESNIKTKVLKTELKIMYVFFFIYFQLQFLNCRSILDQMNLKHTRLVTILLYHSQ